MRNNLRKCKGIGDVTVVEISHVGARTRGQRRKLRSEEFQMGGDVKIREHKLEIPTENLVNSKKIHANPYPRRGSNFRSSEVLAESTISVDLEAGRLETAESSDDHERREFSYPRKISSEVIDINATSSSKNERFRRLSSISEKTPLHEEIEEFFSAAEKCEINRFAEKYNFDVVKDVPLEGRFEWVRILGKGRRSVVSRTNHLIEASINLLKLQG